MEELKPLSIDPENYMISSFGYLLNRKKGTIVGGSISKYDYQTISVKVKGKTYALRNLVAMEFLGYKPNGKKYLVYHRNDDKSDCRVSNLVIDRNRCVGRYGGKSPYDTSEHRGVSWDQKKGRWRGKVEHRGERYELGLFDTEEEARRAVEYKRKRLGI